MRCWTKSAVVYAVLLLNAVAQSSEGVGRVQIGADDRTVFTPDHKTLALVDIKSPEQVQIWDLHQRKLLRTLRLPDSNIGRALGCSPDSKLLAVGTDKGNIYVWSMESEGEAKTLQPGGDPTTIQAIAMSATGRLVAGFQENSGTLLVWSLHDQKTLATITVPEKRLVHCAFTRDETAVLAIFDTEVWQWDPNQNPAPLRVAEDLSVVSVTPSLDADMLAVSIDNKLELWSTAAFKRTEPLDYSPPVSAVFLRGAAKLLIPKHSGENAYMDLWDIRGGAEQAIFVRSIKGTGGMLPEAIADNGKHVTFTANSGKHIVISNPDLTQLRNIGENHNNGTDKMSSITNLAFSPDGTKILSALEDGMLRFWNTEDGRLISQIESNFRIDKARFVGDGVTIALTSPFGGVELLDAVGDHFAPAVSTFQVGAQGNKPGEVIALDLSPDGLQLAVQSNDAIWLFDTVTRNCLGSIRQQPVMFGYSGDGAKLLFINQNGRYHYNFASSILQKIDETDLGMLGIEFNPINERIMITDLFPNGPAAATKQLNKGDRILAVAEGTSEEFVPLDQNTKVPIGQLLNGPIGTSVRLRIVNSRGASAEVEIQRKGFKLSGENYAVTPTGNYVVTPTEPRKTVPRMINGLVYDKHALWAPETGRVVAMLTPRTLRAAGQQQVSPDGKLFATLAGRADGDGVGIEIFDILSGEIITEMPVEIDGFIALSFSPDGNRLLVLTSRSVEIVDYRRGKITRTLKVFDVVKEQAIDASSPFAAPLLAAQERLAFGPSYTGALNCMAMSPRGLIALGSEDGEIRLLTEKSETPLGILPHARHPVMLMKFSDDGTKLCYVIENTVYMMDVPESGEADLASQE